MTPHPQQCKTCQKFKSIKEKGKFNSNIGWCEEKPIFPNDYNFILQIGCASHSSDKSEQEIRLLDELLEIIDNYFDTGYSADDDLLVILHGWIRELRSKQGEQP